MLLRERLRKQTCSAKVAKDDNMQRCVISNWGFGTQTLRKVRERSAKVAQKLRCPKSRGSLLQEVHIKAQKANLKIMKLAMSMLKMKCVAASM